MVNGTHLHTTVGYAEGGVLDALEFSDGAGEGTGEPDRGSVDEKGGDEKLVGEGEGLLTMFPGGTSKG